MRIGFVHGQSQGIFWPTFFVPLHPGGNQIECVLPVGKGRLRQYHPDLLLIKDAVNQARGKKGEQYRRRLSIAGELLTKVFFFDSLAVY